MATRRVGPAAAAASPRPVIYVALACSAAIAIAKFIAAAASGSAAMAAEGVHSTGRRDPNCWKRVGRMRNGDPRRRLVESAAALADALEGISCICQPNIVCIARCQDRTES